jgi:hypothetical protein
MSPLGLIQFDFTEAPRERPVRLWCDCGELGTRADPSLVLGINALRVFVPTHREGCKPHVEFKP